GRGMRLYDHVVRREDSAQHDPWITADLGRREKKLYQDQGGKCPDPIDALTVDYKNPLQPQLDEIAQEINGKDLTTGKRLATFANLKADGTTTAGDWIYTGSYPDRSAPAAAGRPSANLPQRRDGIQDPAKNDPTGLGFYPNWAWSWPLNRRILS